jgi:hypothetical protein
MTDILTRDNLRPLADELTRSLLHQNETIAKELADLKCQLGGLERAIQRLLTCPKP